MIDKISEKIIIELMNQKQPITSKEIANSIGMSLSSVKHSMPEVKRIAERCGVAVFSSPSFGIQLVADYAKKRDLYFYIRDNRDIANSFELRKKYILNILFARNSNYTIQVFADDLGIGRNVLSKDLDKIEKWLAYFDLKLVRVQNKGVYIDGLEFDKRQAIISSNSQFEDNIEFREDLIIGLDSRISQTFFNYYVHTYKTDILKIQALLRDFECEANMDFEDVSFTQLIEYITVSQIRINEGNIILEHSKLNKYSVTKEVSKAATKLIKAISYNLNEDLSFEIKSLSLQCFLYGVYDVNASSVMDSKYNEIVSSFLNKLNFIISNKQIIINDVLIKDISAFLKKKKLQNSYHQIKGGYIKRDIKEQTPSLYGLVLISVNEIENSLKISFSDEDVAYLTMLISNAVENETHTVSAAFITSFDYNTAKYLTNKILREISAIQIKKIIRLESIVDVDFSLFDIIITTVLMGKDDVIKVSRRIDDVDISILQNSVDSILKKKREVLTIKHNLVFDVNLIGKQISAKSKEEAIEVGVSLLKDNGYVGDGFLEDVLNRESLVSTYIGRGVAIPHGYKNNVNKSGFSLIRLEKPLIWGMGKVDIVFVIAINYLKKTEINSFFSRFYSLIEDEKTLEAIRNAKTRSEIYNLIVKKDLINIE